MSGIASRVEEPRPSSLFLSLTEEFPQALGWNNEQNNQRNENQEHEQ
jgi:hypothetical protein